MPGRTIILNTRTVFERVVVVAVLAGAAMVPRPATAGGVGFIDDTSGANPNAGPPFFGFVRSTDGPGVAGAKVTAEVKGKGAVVTRTDILGLYKLPGFAKTINPDDVVISCAKDGYKQTNVVRRPNAAGDTKTPIEIDCTLQKQ
jgi:hypothetical protein